MVLVRATAFAVLHDLFKYSLEICTMLSYNIRLESNRVMLVVTKEFCKSNVVIEYDIQLTRQVWLLERRDSAG